MKSGKAPGPTGMTSDLIKRGGITGELTRVFSGIVGGEKVPKNGKTV